MQTKKPTSVREIQKNILNENNTAQTTQSDTNKTTNIPLSSKQKTISATDEIKTDNSSEKINIKTETNTHVQGTEKPILVVVFHLKSALEIICPTTIDRMERTIEVIRYLVSSIQVKKRHILLLFLLAISVNTVHCVFSRINTEKRQRQLTIDLARLETEKSALTTETDAFQKLTNDLDEERRALLVSSNVIVEKLNEITRNWGEIPILFSLESAVEPRKKINGRYEITIVATNKYRLMP